MSSPFPNETSFIKGHLSTIASIPISFPDTYQPSLDQYSRKIGVFPVELPPPPEHKIETASSGDDTINVVFKAAKPPISFPLTISASDTISTIKQQLAAQPRAPSADIQRLLLKGKPLADAKLLKEYNVQDGAVINLMVKPGARWDASETTFSTVADSSPPPQTSDSKASSIPALVVEDSADGTGKSTPIPLKVDTGMFPPVPQSAPEISTFHSTIASPGFWDRLHLFLRTEFPNKEDAAAAFETFLLASKGSLTVGEIAKIRDQVGVVGMAGT